MQSMARALNARQYAYDSSYDKGNSDFYGLIISRENAYNDR